MTSPATAPTRPVTNAEREVFRTDGVVKLESIHPPDRVEQLRQAMDEVFSRTDAEADATWTGESRTGDRSDMAALMSQRRAEQGAAIDIEGDPVSPIRGRAIVETDAASWHVGLRRHHVESGLAQTIAELTGTHQVTLYSDQLFSKEPGSLSRTPWHQDAPYFLVGSGTVAVCWITVDPVRRDNGAMGYVPGSHLWGTMFKPSDFVTREGTFTEVGDIDHSSLAEMPPRAEIEEAAVYIEADPGDVIVHHWCTVHGSSGNTTENRSRRAASIRFACDGATFLRKPSSPEPFRNTVELADGDPLELDPRFPVVWPRQLGSGPADVSSEG
ncbi:MAG: phytanoyl-CoA dioxygenase family protein [Acidimicrobiales bacterium]